MISRVGRAGRAAAHRAAASPQPQPAFGGAQCPLCRRRRAGRPPFAGSDGRMNLRLYWCT
eukprot:4849756-Prymnesium_polylepis.1